MLYDDVRSGVSLIAQCLSNILTVRLSFLIKLKHFISIQAINGPLQNRMRPLDLDDHIPELSSIDLSNQSTEAFSLLTTALNIHLNIDQPLIINTPSISNQSFEQIENSRISFPADFSSKNLPDETMISFRVCLDCLIFFIFSLYFSQLCNH